LSCDSDALQVGSAWSDSTRVVKVNRHKTNCRKTKPYCILLYESFSEKKDADYINIDPVIKCYISTGILMYTHNCNQKFYNVYILSCSTNKQKIIGQVSLQKQDTREVLTYPTTWPNSSIKKCSSCYPMVCATSK
jgi:hypothetical protein